MRLAIISDIHEDITNLRHILGRIEQTGYDRLVCLGDISGFSIPHYRYSKTRNARDCLLLLREKEAIIIPGNHDLHAGRMIPGNSTIFDFPDDWYDLDHHQRFSLANEEIWLHEEHDLDPLYTAGDIAYLRSLPEYQVMEDNGMRILLSHYIYPNLSGFRKGFYNLPGEFREHFGFMERLRCSLSFSGHAHVRGFYLVTPGQFRHFRYRNLTIGSYPAIIGIQPVTRHRKRSGFCIFDTESRILKARRYVPS